jgi:hypothetical protein
MSATGQKPTSNILALAFLKVGTHPNAGNAFVRKHARYRGAFRGTVSQTGKKSK